MRPVYLRKKVEGFERKILADMAYLSAHKILRILKSTYEHELYIPYYPDLKDKKNVEYFKMERNNIYKEDDLFYYFKIKLKPEQFESQL